MNKYFLSSGIEEKQDFFVRKVKMNIGCHTQKVNKKTIFIAPCQCGKICYIIMVLLLFRCDQSESWTMKDLVEFSNINKRKKQ